MGKNKDFLRENFETESGKSPLTSKGEKTSAYKAWLLKNCKGHWMAEANNLFKLESDLISGKLSYAEAKAKAAETTKLQEKCVILPSVRVKRKLKDFENRFGESKLVK